GGDCEAQLGSGTAKTSHFHFFSLPGFRDNCSCWLEWHLYNMTQWACRVNGAPFIRGIALIREIAVPKFEVTLAI
ncbi:MAG: hypothetical protein ACKVOF_07950, partial [Pseudohongiellaceae bacterium]